MQCDVFGICHEFVYLCVIFELLKIFNVSMWGVLKAKASAVAASCAGLGKAAPQEIFEVLNLTGWSLCPHSIISICHGSSFLLLVSSVTIALQTTSVSGYKRIKGLERCYKVLDILRFMPKPQ